MNIPLSGARPAEILLVEDNENDVELTYLSFKNSKVAVNLHHAKDGEACMAFLRKQGEYATVPTPDLILLDLNMPRMNGREVMMAIAADERLCQLPVVILTTSQGEEEILKMYKLRCSSYIVKPVDFDQFVHVVHTLTNYWFAVVVLPATLAPGKVS